MFELRGIEHNPVQGIGIIDNAPFSRDYLNRNFLYMGQAWGNNGKEYWQIDTEIGLVCIVDQKHVYLCRGNKEQLLDKINNPKMLDLFIGMLN